MAEKHLEEKNSKYTYRNMFDTESSLFLTPPLSGEISKTKTCSRILQNDNGTFPMFQLDESASDCSTEKDDFIKIDYIKELHKMSLTSTVCSKIFQELTDIDLVRASHVSSVWRSVIRYADIKSGRRTSRYLRRIKNGYVNEKENCCKLKNVDNSKPSNVSILSEIRTPLSFKTINRITTPEINNDNDNLFLTPTPLSTSSSYRQCPECQSPARTTFKQTGHCVKCNHDFCVHCFYTKDHSPTCQSIGGSGITSSPNKISTKSRRYSVGSKSNKARLKRL